MHEKIENSCTLQIIFKLKKNNNKVKLQNEKQSAII